MNIKIGTRDSKLAIWQAKFISSKLKEVYPKISLKIIPIKSKADKLIDIPLHNIGIKGLFTKELDEALLKKKIHIAVHSLKDIPTEFHSDIHISAITKRHDPRDALVSKKGRSLKELPLGATIATGSLRRRSQILNYRPDIKIIDLRGNLMTRYLKFNKSDWDGMILAVAGIERMKLEHTISEKISTDILLPCVGQGSIAVMSHKKNVFIYDMMRKIYDHQSSIHSTAERSFLHKIGGGCSVPIAAYSELIGNKIKLRGFVGDINGEKTILDTVFEKALKNSEAKYVGEKLADKLIRQGAHQILKS